MLNYDFVGFQFVFVEDRLEHLQSSFTRARLNAYRLSDRFNVDPQQRALFDDDRL